MSVPLSRRRQALISLGGGIFLLFSGLLAVFWQTDPGVGLPPGTLTPRLPDDPALVFEIEIEDSDESVLLRRTLEGWALVSNEGFPADAALAGRLIAALAALEPMGERTHLTERYEALGLGDPATGGDGTRIVMRDTNQGVLADLVIGRQRADGQLYVRHAASPESWLVRGYIPEISSAAHWMELDFLALGRSAIREACILPESGPGYCLRRPSLSSERFDIVSPAGYRLVSPGAGDGVATTLARVRFRDVRPAREIRGPRDAEHRITTVNGLELTVSVFERDGEYWAKLVAIAQSDAARDAAVAINERADGWAFRLSDLTVDRLIRPLPGLAVAVSDSPRE
ncbi:DUF4340 domain-containing protein [Hyphobacterium sp.]|uniref:DUF4340 domain-containing protein n=1 Tax=Hyphobacterium sp. TaxID=2004662 RepID=UPI003B520EF3